MKDLALLGGTVLPPLLLLLEAVLWVFDGLTKIITALLSPFKDISSLISGAAGDMGDMFKDIFGNTDSITGIKGGLSMTDLLKQLNPLSGAVPSTVNSGAANSVQGSNSGNGGITTINNYNQNNGYSTSTLPQGQDSTSKSWEQKLWNMVSGFL